MNLLPTLECNILKFTGAKMCCPQIALRSPWVLLEENEHLLVLAWELLPCCPCAHWIVSFPFSVLHSQEGEAFEDKECAFQLCHRVLLHQEAGLHERAQPGGQHAGHVQPPQQCAPVHPGWVRQGAGAAAPGDAERTPQGREAELSKTKGKNHELAFCKAPYPYSNLNG